MAGPLDGLDLGAPTATPNKKVAGSGPLAGFDPNATPDTMAAPAAPPTPMPAAMTYDKDDPNAGWGSWALSKLHNAAVGGNLFNRVVTDSATFGGADKLQSLVPGGPSVDELRAQTDQSRKDIGPVASAIADASGYALGGGSLGAGEKIAARLGGGYLARIGGSALESGGASALGTLGHGGDVDEALKSGGVGLLLGGAAGAIPGARGANAGAVRPSTSDLEATASGLYAPLSKTQYPTDAVERVISNVNVPQGLQAKMSNALSDQIDRIKGIVAQGGKTTANDIADFRASLLGAAKNDTDMLIAGKYVSALENGVGPKIAGDIAAANAASNTAKTSGEIDNWITQAGREPGKVPNEVNKAITNTPGFYKGVMPELQDVANTGQGVGSKIWEAVKKPVIGAAIDAGANYVAGQSPLAGAITGGLTGAIMGHGEGQARTNTLVNKLAAARHLNATGQRLQPATFNRGLGPVVGPMVAYAPKIPAALGASGMFTPNQ